MQKTQIVRLYGPRLFFNHYLAEDEAGDFHLLAIGIDQNYSIERSVARRIADQCAYDGGEFPACVAVTLIGQRSRFEPSKKMQERKSREINEIEPWRLEQIRAEG